MITRELNIAKNIRRGKVFLLMGPRQVGKTTLLNKFLQDTDRKYIKYTGDDFTVQEIFSDTRMEKLASYVDGYDIVAIDEAQKIKNIGESLKLIIDSRPNLQVIATGSSSFDLQGQVGEPLVGRARNFFMYPVSLKEYASYKEKPLQYAIDEKLDEFLVYGMYPEVLLAKNNSEKSKILMDFVNKLLLRDILDYQEVKGSDVLYKLLQLLAFQIGSEVSHDELGRKLGISKNTVARYLDLLEKSYIIFNLGGFSRNLRKEITKMSKYFFYDLGVRNAIVNNFNRINLRDDAEKGQLFENYVIVERLKHRSYNGISANQYFWRTWSKQEIDLIEERKGKLFAYEIKYNDKKAQNAKVPDEFKEEYAGGYTYRAISSKNLGKYLK
jgi:predicted AAA+ superfamily ATPase